MKIGVTPSDERTHIKVVAEQVRSLVACYLDTAGFAFNCVPFLDRIEQLSAIITLWGTRMNLTAQPDDPQELAFHIIDSLTPVIFADREELLGHAFREGNRVLDLGSGAGFPALVLASASPASFTLIESRRKRASFLAVAAADIDLKNVIVESRRIKPEQARSSPSLEDIKAKGCDGFDVVTARSYAHPPTFYSVAASALRPSGIAVLYANSEQDLALPEAEKNSLYEFQSIAYTIPRSSRA
ncbi:MAG: class I SAM-dependent methyltransferase, partial [Deltaproteobacteria bacterium]|nr:class I SAM-dependent methyltransferase [Deltaproteobacteria bacterium]